MSLLVNVSVSIVTQHTGKEVGLHQYDELQWDIIQTRTCLAFVSEDICLRFVKSVESEQENHKDPERPTFHTKMFWLRVKRVKERRVF